MDAVERLVGGPLGGVGAVVGVGKIAVAVGGEGFGAGPGDAGTARGLGVLPDVGIWGAAGGDGGRVQGAAVRGRTGILIDEVGDGVERVGLVLRRGDALLDVERGGDGVAVALVHRLAAEVGPGAVAGGGDGLGPAEQVGGLFGQQAAALLLVEEEDGAGVMWRERWRERISASRRPLASTRKPKPWACSSERLPTQVFWVSPGGLVIQ
jgi:hypothetical protein